MMRKIQYWLRRFHAHLMHRLAPKTLFIPAKQPVISFTFDDVPDSALHQGAVILEQYGLRGTFYVAGGLSGASADGRVSITEKGIRELDKRGHEVGCHTFSHPDISRISSAQLQVEADNSRKFLDRVLEKNTGKQSRPRNFAYPFNAVSYFALSRMRRNYRSCRAGENRINRGATSPQMLLGMEIRQPEAHALQRMSEIDAVKAQPGWLIFFTHDISDTPSPYGCTPETFEKLVQYAVQSGCTILTVDKALDHYETKTTAK